MLRSSRASISFLLLFQLLLVIKGMVWLPGKQVTPLSPKLDSTQVGTIDCHIALELLSYLPPEFFPAKKSSTKKKKKTIKRKGDYASPDTPAIRREITHSIDLGHSVRPLVLDTSEEAGGGLLDTKGNLLASIEELTEIARNKRQGCFALFDDGSAPWKINTMSVNTDKPASLCPPLEGTGPPTMVLGGFTMHRIVGEQVSPATDTEAKLSAVRLFPGAKVLDTCCGLGYTAILAARRVGHTGKVVTVELDDASIEMCCANPHSMPLFDGTLLPQLEVVQGNSCELIHCFEEGVFDVIVHDPPARAICETDLYSETFYSLLRSRLKNNGGQLFHYVGSPTSSESGRLYSGISARLKAAGFASVEKFPAAFGLVARA
jgi:predicted methyltransferase